MAHDALKYEHSILKSAHDEKIRELKTTIKEQDAEAAKLNINFDMARATIAEMEKNQRDLQSKIDTLTASAFEIQARAALLPNAIDAMHGFIKFFIDYRSVIRDRVPSHYRSICHHIDNMGAVIHDFENPPAQPAPETPITTNQE